MMSLNSTDDKASLHETPPSKGSSSTTSGIEKPRLGEIPPVHWTASQFIAHKKGAPWYAGLILAGAVLAGLAYLITRGDKVATSAMVIATAFFGIAASRPPRTIQYELNSKGLVVGQRFFSYDMFKSFAVVPEGAITTVVFLPLKRFMPSVTIYCAPESEEQVVSTIGDFLPMHEAHRGLLDHFLERIRF